MATSNINIDTGSTLGLATNTVSEDAITKHIGRSIINNSSGTELGNAAAPFKVDLATIGSGTLATITSVSTIGVVANIASVGAVVTVSGSLNTVNTVLLVASITSVNTVGVVANIASVGTVVTVAGTINTINTVLTLATINTINTLMQFAKTVKNVSFPYSAAAETTLVPATSGKKIKVCAFSIVNATTAVNTILFKSSTTGSTVWSIDFVPQGVQGANLAVPIPGYIFSSSDTTTPVMVSFATANTARVSVAYFDDDES